MKFLIVLLASSCLSLFSGLCTANPVWDWISDDFQVLMRTHGQINFAPYVHGTENQKDWFPGYRSDFHTFVDFFEWKGWVSNWLIANSTIIERPDSTAFRLDRIRYTLTPGYYREFENHMLSGLLLHECIHTISQPEEDGSIWWNSFQFGLGSKGAYPQFLVPVYQGEKTGWLNQWDWQANMGFFLFGNQSVWIAQNHNYRYEFFSLLRYHMGRIRGWGGYVDLDQHSWVRADNQWENKFSLTANLLLAGKFNMAGLYYSFVFYDTNSHDNEDKLGSLGFNILF